MLTTEWGEALDRSAPLPEYPRPQLVRDSYINLNGPWEYAFTGDMRAPSEFEGEIVVPFAPESALSGVGRTLRGGEYLWYRRKLVLPEGFNRGRVLLHFGAVDQTARVWVNGRDAVAHTGGYLPFSADITELLEEENTILVRVSDDTDESWHTRGKQKSRRGGIWYTPLSGIWQTVWCESVPEQYIRGLFITPRLAERAVELFVDGEGECRAVIDGEEYRFPAGQPAVLELHGRVREWTPEAPELYRFSLTLGEDRVESYFAMRSFGVGEDRDGVKRLLLNGKPYFHNGVLDQGWWPDGLYTAPSDEALEFDIQTAKAMGFNMLRKHVKVESARWYYHCDRLGMLVWQDMPNGGGKYSPAVVSAPLLTGWHMRDDKYGAFGRKSERGRREFTAELREMVLALYNCPCIAMWVPFNEGWGQFDAEQNVEAILSIDQTRTIDHASGWHDQGIGEIKSLHVYFDEYRHTPDKRGRCVVLSEFGGYTCRVDGHAMNEKAFGYKKFKSPSELRTGLMTLYDGQIRPAVRKGLSATVYTQLTDVEDELNGLITYDRRVLKLAPDAVARTVRMPDFR